VAEQANPVAEMSYAALVAIDWADQKHVWSLHAAGSRKRETGELQHTPEAVESWVGQLCQRFGEQPIAVAVEQRRGALVFMLSKYEQLHIFPVPPTMSANLRKALYPSGAKDDPKDAELLLDILEKYGNKLRRLQPDTEPTRRIQNLVEERRKLVDEKTAQSNRLMANLKIYFPQLPRWFKEVDSDLVCDLLQRWPTLEKLQKAQTAKLYDFFRRHRMGNEERILGLLKEIRQARPAISDQAVQEAKVATVKVSVGLLEVLRQGIKEMDRKIQEAAASHPDFFIFKSLPGAGPVMAPRLLAAFGSQRERFTRVEELQVYSGISPVISSSGKSRWIHFRFGCPKFLRQTFHEWAGHSIVYSTWARAYYQLQRSRGKQHHAAVRALAFKWIRIAFRCWKERVAYQESSYLDALQKRNAPLLAALL
jgi:transposase